MLYLIIYDIAENKIRTQIAKSLEQEGCQRIQKSVFIAELNAHQKLRITAKLKEIYYQNEDLVEKNDNILLFPYEKDQVRQTEMIGENKDLKAFLEPPKTYYI